MTHPIICTTCANDVFQAAPGAPPACADCATPAPLEPGDLYTLRLARQEFPPAAPTAASPERLDRPAPPF